MEDAKNQENLVLDTAGGEMPDANRKLTEKASDAAKAFEKSNATQPKQKLEEKKPELAKKAS